MRFILYNIRYGTWGSHMLFPWSGYLRRTTRNLENIAGFLKGADPDIVGLVEVDEGSYRSRRQNQAETIARHIGHFHSYRSKYASNSLAQNLPVLNKQGNAFLTRDTMHAERFHYFDRGVKRLVIELELDNLVIFLVHLALQFNTRQHQLNDLYGLVKGTRKPHIVAGDFNARWGDRETRLFTAATGLSTANLHGLPSYPTRAPRRELDFILHSPEIRSVRFDIPKVSYSDHLPLVWDFDWA